MCRRDRSGCPPGLVKVLFRCCIVQIRGRDTVLRIGELSKRSGVSPELLRAWERRYGLLRPTRSPGGLRLYSLDDLERVRRHASTTSRADSPRPRRRPWRRAPARGDEPRSRRCSPADGAARSRRRARRLRRAARAGGPRPAARQPRRSTPCSADVVLPYLHELGERWQRGEASIAQEHFASTVLRGRLLGLARGWGRGLGPLALLACLPGEQHDLGLIAFGLALRSRGWRIAYLGTDTPLETLDEAARSLAPALVVVGRGHDDRVRPVAARAARARRAPPARARRQRRGRRPSARARRARPDGDPVAAAERVTALVQSARPA